MRILKVDRRIFFALIPLLLFSILFTFPTLAQEPTIVQSFDSPCDYPTGLAWDGQYLLISDIFEGKIYKVDPSDGQTVSTFDSPAEWPAGLAWDGQYLWISNVEEGNEKIYKVDPSDGQVISSFDAPGEYPYPTGLAWDGQYLWILDMSEDIYKVDPSDGQVVSSFSFGECPTGLAWDGQYLWVSDVCDYKIYKVDPSDGQEVRSYDSPDEEDPEGLTWDGQYLWVSTWDGEGKIYKLDVAEGGLCLGTILIAFVSVVTLGAYSIVRYQKKKIISHFFFYFFFYFKLKVSLPYPTTLEGYKPVETEII